ncbi:MAG: DUF2278 family protein [Candidatus Thiosymbion ectosymbiont of Robbea hypermnestra]|nr:DUF2278 family protein [Candidatus Thiosymbion ectosymbiont of Robbea hypermnestra]
MYREEFIQLAGGAYGSNEDYEDWSGRDKYDNFWAFFLDRDFGWVGSVYANVPIENLYRHGHSIEHVIPKSVLETQLKNRGRSRSVIKGARTNPFNLLAAGARLNSTRSSFEFDTEGDQPVRPGRIPINPNAVGTTGLDVEREWVIPSRSRGDVARCVLYMILVYELDGLYEEDLAVLRRWAWVDEPSAWELAYNEWVSGRLGIRNPLITGDIERLKEMLQDDSLFNVALLPAPPMPERADTPRSGGLENGYALLIGRVEDTWRGMVGAPHMMLRVGTGLHSWRVAINVRSKHNQSVDPDPNFPGNDLLVHVDENWQHPLADQLRDKFPQPGLHFLSHSGESGALDYIRGNLFAPQDMEIIPSDVPGADNDLFERLEDILKRARARSALVYLFGEPFADGRGLHQVHMNQGSVIDDYKETDGVWQDGGLLIHFQDVDRWTAVFMAFQSQCWHTDDQTGAANEDNRCSRFSEGEDDQAAPVPGVSEGALVRIVSAMVNPRGSEVGAESVTLINLGEDTVNLEGWVLMDRQKRTEPLTGQLAANEARTFVLTGNDARLGNKGGLISLLDKQSLKVHGVSYTRQQGRKEGVPVVFLN